MKKFLMMLSMAMHRGAFYDDGNGSKHFTAKSLARALRQADVHVETQMFQACLMNNMEYQFELKDVCDYVVASTYTMQSNVSFNALIDMTVTRTSNLNQLGVMMREFTDRLCNIYIKFTGAWLPVII